MFVDEKCQLDDKFQDFSFFLESTRIHEKIIKKELNRKKFPTEETKMISFEKNMTSFETKMISFEQNMISFETKMISFCYYCVLFSVGILLSLSLSGFGAYKLYNYYADKRSVTNK
jgi:hypothetical protein